MLDVLLDRLDHAALFVLDRLTDSVHKRSVIGRAMRLDDRARNADEGCTAYRILIEQRAEIIHALLAGQIGELGAQVCGKDILDGSCHELAS